MKRIAQIISYLALAATLLPAVLFFADKLELPLAKLWMLVAAAGLVRRYAALDGAQGDRLTPLLVGVNEVHEALDVIALRQPGLFLAHL